MFSFLLSSLTIYATNDYDISYDEIQSVIDEVMGKNNTTFQFEEQVNQWMSGEESLSLESVIQSILNSIQMKWRENKNLIVQLFSIGMMGALFANFSDIFRSSHLAETGFYVAYLLLFTILTTAFLTASTLASHTLNSLLDFMKVLVPTYFITVTFSSGVATSMAFYEVTLVIITIVDLVLIHIIIPMIQFYFVLNLANNLMKEDKLSKGVELLELLLGWGMKTIFGLVIGFQVIQRMIVPVVDAVKTSAVLKTAKAIPGIGNAFGSVAETIVGAGVLIKNSVGVAGLIVIIIICGIPLLQLAFYSILYQASGAILQPISDTRMINCILGTSKAMKFLLYAIATSAVLFLFTIVIITTITTRI